jgi:DNA-binding NtrC family response regulator
VIEDRTFGRLGGNDAIPVDARLVVLSRERLGDLVRSRTFREDLFFRLNVIPIQLVPLRERTNDIVPLVEHFLRLFGEKYGKPQIKMDRGVLGALKAYPFPGNVRELRNLVDRLVMLAEGDAITSQQLPHGLKATSEANSHRPTLEQLERHYITEILEFTRGRKGKAAAILGISRKTLLEKRKRYGLID